MFHYYHKSHFSLKVIILAVIFIFTVNTIIPSQAMAQGVLGLPVPGTMVSLSPAFTPTILRGIRVYPDNSLKFDFIVDSGDTGLKGTALKNESERLIKYFLAALTIPEDNLWVNLSPHEKDRIIPDSLAQTDMGTDMLAQDYLLKQITASLIYPEDELGKQFWQKIYKKAYEEYGTTKIPVDTFNKVWIMPEHAEVYVKDDRAFVVESKLKVMLEEDYLALEKSAESRATRNAAQSSHANKKADNKLASNIVREIVIPALEKEVNQGKNFAQLRQIYNSLILAYWFKNNLKSSIVNQVYSDQQKVKGVDVENVSQDIYKQYLKSFEKGVCDFIKVEYDQYAQKNIPRKYFSGGVAFGDGASSAITFKKAKTPEGQKAASVIGKVLGNAAFVILVTVVLTISAFSGPPLKANQEVSNKSQIHNVDLGNFSSLEIQNNSFPLDRFSKEDDSLKSSKNKNSEVVNQQNMTVFSDYEEINKRYGFSPNSNSLKALKKLSRMGLNVLRGENEYSNGVAAWQIIALSKEPEVADAIAQEDFEQFYYRVNDTIFGGKGFRKIEDLLGVCDLYNHFLKHQDDKEMFYSSRFKDALNYVRTKFPKLQISTESAVHVLNLARNFDEKETKKIVTQFESSQEGQEIFINDLFVLDYCRINPRFYHFLFNRKDLEKEVLSTIYREPEKDRESGVWYKKERLSSEEINQYPTLFLLRSLLVYESLRKDSDFKDQIIRQIARIYYQDHQDQTTEYGGYLSLKDGKILFNLQAGYSHYNDTFSTRDIMMPIFADFHLHPFDVVDGEIIQNWSGPSEADFKVSINENTGLSQGFVFSAFSDQDDQVKVNIDTYIGDYFFKPFFFKFPKNLNLDLGIITLPDNQDSFKPVEEYSGKDLKRIWKILRKFIKEENKRAQKPETSKKFADLEKKAQKNPEDLFIPENPYYKNLADSVKRAPEKYSKEIIMNFSDIAPFFKNKNNFREILKDAMNKYPELAIKFWAYSYFESAEQPQILLDLIKKVPAFGLQNFNARFRSKDLREDFASGLIEILENNPDIVFEYADNIIQRNSDFFLNKETGFSKKLKGKTENEKISLLISSLRILAGAKMPYDKEHINNAVSLAIDFQEISGNEIYYDKNTTVINILNVEEQFLKADAEELAELGGVPKNKIFSFKGGEESKEDVIEALKASQGTRVILFNGHNTPIFERDEVEDYGIDWEILYDDLVVKNNFATEEYEQMILIENLDKIKEYLKTVHDQDTFKKISHFLDITANRLAFDYGVYLNYEEIVNALGVSGDFSQTRLINLSCDSYNHNWSFVNFLNQNFSQNPQVTVSEADRGEPGSGKEADYLRSIIKTVKEERGNDQEKKPILGRHFLAAKTDAVLSKQHPVIFFFPGKQVVRDLFVKYFGEKGTEYYDEFYNKNDDIDNLPEGGMETGWILNTKLKSQNPLLAFQVSLSPNNSVNENNILFGKLNTDVLDQGEVLGASKGDTFYPSEFYDMTAAMFTAVLRNEDLEVLTENGGKQLLVERVEAPQKASSSQAASSVIRSEDGKLEIQKLPNLKQVKDASKKSIIIKENQGQPSQGLAPMKSEKEFLFCHAIILRNKTTDKYVFLHLADGLKETGSEFLARINNTQTQKTTENKKFGELTFGELLESLGKGEKEAIYLARNKAEAKKSEEYLSNKFNIKTSQFVEITGKNLVSWNMIFEPEINEIIVYGGREAYSFQAFAESSEENVKNRSAKKTASSKITSTGGIDFNAENMNVTTKGDQINFNVPIDMQNISSSSIEGFVPIIINITPVTNFIGLLGLDDTDKKDAEQISYISELIGDKQS